MIKIATQFIAITASLFAGHAFAVSPDIWVNNHTGSQFVLSNRERPNIMIERGETKIAANVVRFICGMGPKKIDSCSNQLKNPLNGEVISVIVIHKDEGIVAVSWVSPTYTIHVANPMHFDIDRKAT